MPEDEGNVKVNIDLPKHLVATLKARWPSLPISDSCLVAITQYIAADCSKEYDEIVKKKEA